MMATGYVHPVANGEVTTLRQFALQCARGMGACIMMRDEPFDAPIPERFEPSTDYHDKAIEEAKRALDDLASISAKEADKRAAADFDAKMKRHVEYVSGEAEKLRRCKAMLEQVQAWTTGAEGLREFMLEQLQTSIGNGRGYSPEPPLRMTGAQWREAAMAKASRDLAHHGVERSKEIARTENRNRWLAELRASLPAA